MLDANITQGCAVLAGKEPPPRFKSESSVSLFIFRRFRKHAQRWGEELTQEIFGNTCKKRIFFKCCGSSN